MIDLSKRSKRSESLLEVEEDGEPKIPRNKSAALVSLWALALSLFVSSPMAFNLTWRFFNLVSKTKMPRTGISKWSKHVKIDGIRGEFNGINADEVANRKKQKNNTKKKSSCSQRSMLASSSPISNYVQAKDG
ncbi:hypothetical protein E2542_SST02009 [Spatholobus suberectus]|nr:hypothetical protein E2542_SST02009 [Spatholobus suberectus]